MQQEKAPTCEECNKRWMQNENIGTCRSATWNRAIKKVQHEKKCNMKRLLHEKVQHGNGAVWRKCNMKKYKLSQWNTQKLHKSSAL